MELMLKDALRSQVGALISEPVKDKIRQAIRRFEISALLKLLGYLGYTIQDISFRSNPILASPSSLCEDIIFPEGGDTRVIIVVNIGFLSAGTPLASFFRKKMESGKINALLFTRFLSFFDHFIIRNLFAMCIPEDNSWFFPDWQEAKRQSLHLIALNSPSSLSLVLQMCFPELKVEVIKSPRVLGTNSSSATLGNTYLGRESFLGQNQQLSISSVKIILTAESMETELKTIWPVEIKKRIRKFLLSFLVKMETYTTVILTVKQCKEKAFLSRTSYLGYSKIGEDKKPFHIRIFSGYLNAAVFDAKK